LNELACSTVRVPSRRPARRAPPLRRGRSRFYRAKCGCRTKDEDEARVRVDAILYKLFGREPTQAEIKQTLQEVKNYSRGEIGEDEDDYYW
jgi:hypothetical protein